MPLNGSSKLREEAWESRASTAPGMNASTNGTPGLVKEGKRGKEETRDRGVGRPSIVNAIRKKRDRKELDKDEIDCFVEGATKSYITEAQIGKCTCHHPLLSSSS